MDILYKKRYRVSVMIPCLNEERFIGRCLDSILDNGYPKDLLEVLVIDGMSTDRTRRIIADYVKKYPFIKILDNHEKTQQKGLNIGVRYATGDFFIRMDAHCSFTKTYIPQCVNYLIRTDSDCVGGRLITVPRDETLLGKAIAIAMSEQFGVGNSHFRIIRKKHDNQEIWVDTVPYGCYRREVFDKVGLYHEDLNYSEDIEFHQRMKKKGCRLLFVPHLINYYYVPSDIKSFLKYALRNGLWAVLPTKYTGRIVVHWRHLVPLIFVSTVVCLGILSLMKKFFLFPLFFASGVYLLTNIIFSTAVAFQKKNIRFLFIMPVVFGALHIGYGLGSLVGLVEVVISRLFIPYVLKGEANRC